MIYLIRIEIENNVFHFLFVILFRNYLANNLAVNSLLGPSELDRVLPAREIKVFVGTWNMNGQHPPKYYNILSHATVTSIGSIDL